MATSVVSQLPKVELHCHLEGAIRLTSIAEIGREFKLPLSSYDLNELRPQIEAAGRTKSLAEWAPIFAILRKCFVNPEVITRLTNEVIEDYARQNTRYLELRFSAGYLAQVNRLTMDEVIRAVLAGIDEGWRQYGLRTSAIVLISRDLGGESAKDIAAAAARFAGRGVVGFDLAGNEIGYPPEQYTAAFQIARAAGLQITVHAGEECGPESIAGAIDALGALRIGHGLHLGDDPALLDRVRRLGIPLEMCPTSNVTTRNVPSLQAHPAHRYYRAGVRVTINADDPVVCATTLEKEYELALTALGFTLPELAETILTSADSAFLPPGDKAALVKEIEASFIKLGIQPIRAGFSRKEGDK